MNKIPNLILHDVTMEVKDGHAFIKLKPAHAKDGLTREELTAIQDWIKQVLWIEQP